METLTQEAPQQRKFVTAQLIAAMLKARGHVSDLIFSPGRAPQIEVDGQLVELKFKGLDRLTAQDTKALAQDLTQNNEHAAGKLELEGSADLSYGVSGVGRFRVNIFRQRGSLAIVMRVIPDVIPGFEELHLPAQLKEIVQLKNGIVLVTGPTGSGKSSTLAAIIDLMNAEKAYHI
ncbi:MAG: ATPase, T2SS/T4P/T4SS family, partial [Candidatus Acidiferrum sp.]